jgi:8-oxo-dGTP pyrophosphatase MutT (NUDIX family)
MTIIQQAAAIPYRFEKEGLYILLIHSRNEKKWIIPKGIIEDGDSARFTAEKETEEEAGVCGKVKNKIVGNYDYFKWNSTCRVKVFAMEVEQVLDDWEEKSFRDRKWVKANEVQKIVKPKALRKIIKQFIKTKTEL